MVTKQSNAVAEVKGFKCTDNEIFEDKDEAQEHQNEIDRKNNIEDFVEDKCWSGMNKGDVIDFLLDNREDILAILK